MADTSPRVIKASAVRELPTRVAFNFEDLRDQAASHIATARQEAEQILQQARREADAIRQKALDEGKTQGRREGLQTASETVQQQVQKQVEIRLAEQVQTTLPAVAQVADLLRTEREAWLSRWEEGAVELALAIASKLIREALTLQPERVVPMVREALSHTVGQTQVQVRLHPADLEQLGQQTQELVRTLSACSTPDVIADPTLTRGDCVLVTRHGEIDARIETMLDRIREELLS